MRTHREVDSRVHPMMNGNAFTEFLTEALQFPQSQPMPRAVSRCKKLPTYLI